jgi:triacylglycerol lipase
MNAIPANLNCILLNACGAAYNVLPGTNVYAPDAIYSPNVPYMQDPQVAAGGEGFINVATVGQCPFGVVVAFRGTLPPSKTDPDSWLDWLQNFFAIPATPPPGPNHVPGQVHSGFFNATASIIHQVQTLVMDLKPGPENPVFITGHSKGGALATIAAYILSQNSGVPDVQPVITIASPRPGDVSFQKGFELVLKQTRFENYRDLVPLVPPPLDFIGRISGIPGLVFTEAGRRLQRMLQSAKEWNYVPVGNLLFVTKDFNVIANEDLISQKLDVAAEFVEDFIKKNFSSFGDAHSLLPGKGYNRGICG